MNYYFYKI